MAEEKAKWDPINGDPRDDVTDADDAGADSAGVDVEFDAEDAADFDELVAAIEVEKDDQTAVSHMHPDAFRRAS